MSCPNCGKPTDEESRFCGFCGSPLTPPQATEAAEPAVSDATPADTAQETQPTEAIASAPATASASTTPTAPATTPAASTAAPTAPATPVAPQNQPTQQFQTMPAAPQSQPTQQFQTTAQTAPTTPTVQPASWTPQAATNPTVAALTKPESIKTMGAGLGIGLAAALVLALLGSIAFFFAGDNLESTLSNIPGMSNVSNMLTGSGGEYDSPNALQIVVTVLVMGISGSLNMTASASGFSDYSDDGTHLCLPVGLPGIALMLGAAFGVYMLARKHAVHFKWTGVIGSGIVGLLSGLVIVVLAAALPLSAGGSYGPFSASVSLSGASFRTFCMAFLLAGLGALAGYALAQYAPDSGNVFTAGWRWAHRVRGFVRTFVETVAVYGALFLVLGLIALIAVAASEGNVLAGVLLIPLLLPALPFILHSMASLGGISTAFSGSGSGTTFTLFKLTGHFQYAWVLWLCFALFVIATLYIALRASARNMYDPYYAKWENTWKAPVAMMAFWLVAGFVFTSFSVSYDSYKASMTIPLWYCLVAGIWMFAVEALALSFGPTVITSLPGLWRMFVGGTVQQTPQNVVDYVKACDPQFGMPKAVRTATAVPTVRMQQTMTQPASTQPAPTQPAPMQPVAPAQSAPAAPVAPATSAPQPTAVPASPAPAPVAPAAPAVERKPLSPKAKKTIMIGGIVAIAIIALGIIYGVLSSTVFSAKSMAESYVSALASGDYDKVSSIADPQIGKDQRKLLSNSVAKVDSATISNPHVDSVKTSNGTTTAAVSYTLDGTTINENLSLNKSGTRFLIFPNWQITTPLVKSVNVTVPDCVETLTVNKVAVTAKNAEKNGNVWRLRVYPGAYSIAAESTDYISGGSTTFRTGKQNESTVEVTVKATSKLESDLEGALNAKLDKCAESTEASPASCPFGYNVYDDDEYRNFAWSISKYPEIKDIDLENGSFTTKSGKAKLTYEWQIGDEWEPSDTSDTFHANGSFAIKDGKVTITFDDDGYYY